MSKTWGGVGAWALDAERAEDEESRLAASEPLATAAAPVLAGEPVQNFPSLREAAATKSKKKKKAIPLTLSEFTTGANVGPGAGRRSTSSVESKGLTSEEMLRLPTGPRERSAEELEQSRGFRSYGFVSGTGGSRGWFPNRDREGEWSGGRRPYGGGIDEEQRRGPPPSRASDLDQPSRADEVDNWAATKKSFPAAPAGSGRPDRYSSLGSGSSSRADEVDNWSRGKQTQQFRQSGFGSGFRGSPGPSDSDRWFRGGGAGSLLLNGEKERPKLVLDPPKGDLGVPQEPARNRPSPFGAARPREEVLEEKGMDWRKMDTKIETKKTNRPTSSHSSRPSSVQSSRPGSPGSQAVVPAGVTDEAPKPQPKVNPFGDAKPREVLLEEKGKDWRKIDLELEHHRDDRF